MSFLERHRGTLIGLATVAGAAAMIWLDDRPKGGLASGTASPAFEVARLDGTGPVSLTDLHGHPALLDFWATWCGPCRQSLPHIDALSRRYAGRVAFYAVNAENEAPAAQARVRDELKLTLPVLSNGREAANRFHVEVLPTTVLLDSEGRVAKTFTGVTGEDEIARALDGLL